MARSIKEIRRDELLARFTTDVIEYAARHTAEIDGFDVSDGPVSVRLSRGAASFCDAVASQLGVSRSRAIELCIEFTRRSVTA